MDNVTPSKHLRSSVVPHFRESSRKIGIVEHYATWRYNGHTKCVGMWGKYVL